MDQAPVQAVDVREGLDDTLVMLSGKLKQGVKIERDFANDLPRIEGFGSELNQVWTNIIDNAVAAMSGNGTLALKTYRDGDQVVVEIADDGPGIPADVQEKIFDPFFTTKAPGRKARASVSISATASSWRNTRARIGVGVEAGGDPLHDQAADREPGDHH